MWREPSVSAASRSCRAATAACLALAGCAGTPYVASPLERRPLGEGFPAYEAPPEPSDVGRDAPPEADPTGPITLTEALALALEQSPELAASSWEVRAREARALQAGLRPNPEIGVEIEDFGGTGETSGFQEAESKFLVAQRIETAGKRPRRRRAAELDADVASWEYEVARLDVFAAVVKAFVGVLAAQERVAVTEELARIAESSVDAVERLVSAGATPPADRTRAAVEASAARVDLAVARRALEASRAELAATWGSLVARFPRAEGEIGTVAPPPSEESVRAWLERNPELALWDREIARRQSLVELADARAIPDVEAGAGVRRLSSSNDTALVAEVVVPLPVFDRNQGERGAARSELAKARRERAATHARLAAGLESAYQELAARYEEVSTLQGEILPGAQDAFEQVRRGYLRGLFRNVDVLDAQRRLFEFRLREIDAQRSYHSAKAEVERLTGTPVAPHPAAP